jgi:ankyrin repeat protein
MLLNRTDDAGHAPLHYAAIGASLHTTKLLIKEGAQVDIRSTDATGRTPLHFAAAANAAQVIDYLLKQGASGEARDRYEDTPMMVAAKFHCLDALKIFFQWNADSAAKDSDGAGVLSRCVVELAKNRVLCDAQVVLYLVKMGLDPNQADKLGIAPMHHIFTSERLRGFFVNGALSIENAPPYPWKELSIAKEHWIKGEEDKTFYLLVRALGMEALRRILNLHPAEGFSPLCLAAWMGDVNRMQDFISIGADVEFEDSEKGTALMAACSYGQLEAVKFLVRSGARISYWSKGRQHSALRAAKRHPIIVNWLLVERFWDQPRIVGIGDLKTPQSLEKLCFWSGPHQAELPLKGKRERRNNESAISWLARLTQMRRDLHGKVAFGIEVSPDPSN